MLNNSVVMSRGRKLLGIVKGFCVADRPTNQLKIVYAFLALISAVFAQYIVPVEFRLYYTIGFVPIVMGGVSFFTRGRTL